MEKGPDLVQSRHLAGLESCAGPSACRASCPTSIREARAIEVDRSNTADDVTAVLYQGVALRGAGFRLVRTGVNRRPRAQTRASSLYVGDSPANPKRLSGWNAERAPLTTARAAHGVVRRPDDQALSSNTTPSSTTTEPTETIRDHPSLSTTSYHRNNRILTPTST